MSIRHIHRRLGSQHATELHPLVHLWILRLLVPLMGYKKFIYNAGFADDPGPKLFNRPAGQTGSAVP